jgi:hypothetical protein
MKQYKDAPELKRLLTSYKLKQFVVLETKIMKERMMVVKHNQLLLLQLRLLKLAPLAFWLMTPQRGVVMT